MIFFGKYCSRLYCQFISQLILFLFLSVCCTSVPVSAAENNRELLFGIEPEHNIFDQVQKYRMLADYLSQELGVKVRLTITSRYGELVKRFKSLHLDGAFLSSFTATVAMKELYLTPLAKVEGEEGSTGSRAYVFVRKDSGIKGVEQLRGKRVVFVDPATTEGYVFARAYFRQQGIDDLDSYLGPQNFAGSHASAIYTVLDGRADIGSAKNTVFDHLIKKEPSIEQELQIIAQSPPVPEVALCVKSELDPDLLEKLQIALLKMDQTVEGRRVLKQLEVKRFAPSSPADFSVVLEMAETAGLLMSDNADSQ